MIIDTLVLIIGDPGAGKSNQIRSIFEEFELYSEHNGYPLADNIRRNYIVHPDIDLLVRLASWHERGDDYEQVKADIQSGQTHPDRRYKIIAPAQVARTRKLIAGDELFVKLHKDFHIRRAYAVWLSPDVQSNIHFKISSSLATFLSSSRSASTLAIDSHALHPRANPSQNSINARLMCDLLFRT